MCFVCVDGGIVVQEFVSQLFLADSEDSNKIHFSYFTFFSEICLTTQIIRFESIFSTLISYLKHIYFHLPIFRLLN